MSRFREPRGEEDTAIQVGRQILAGDSLLRSGQTQVGEPEIALLPQ
jgi:hypothetical protein